MVSKTHKEKLTHYCQEKIFPNEFLSSRVHPFKRLKDATLFLKRDDELSFGISGSKLRKYHSFIPYLVSKTIKEALIIGGPHSNNVVGLCQKCLENGIQPTVFLRKPANDSIEGNKLLIHILIPQSRIHWIDRNLWDKVEEIVHGYKKPLVEVVPEGCNHFRAMPGALTLALDIAKNEIDCHMRFDHIFVDAGTGFQAASLILGLGFLEHPSICHVVQLAKIKNGFKKLIEALKYELSNEMDLPKNFRLNYQQYEPKNAKSFGSINATVIDYSIKIARSLGVLTDPIYSAKLFFETERIIEEKGLSGNILLIHSGGGLAMFGYSNQYRNAF